MTKVLGNTEKDKRRKRLLVAAVLLMLALILIGAVMAKYLLQNEYGPGQMSSEKFYLTTDITGDPEMIAVEEKKGEETETYYVLDKCREETWHLYGGSTHQFNVKVQNYFDDLRITPSDIEYKVKLEAEDEEGKAVALPDKSILNFTVDGTAYQTTKDLKPPLTLVSNSKKPVKDSDDFQVNIPACGSGTGQWDYEDQTDVIMTISSTSPYEEDIKLHFVVHKANEYLAYRIDDKTDRNYAELIIMNSNIEDGVQPYIKWDDSLVIDRTNSLTYTGEFIQQPGIDGRNMQISRKIKSNESVSIVFFKDSPNLNYTKAKTKVKKEGGEYVIEIEK